MNMFAYNVAFDSNNAIDLETGVAPDSNFNTILSAFAAVFVVLTADGWSLVYFLHYLGIPTFGTTVYFIALIILGQRILLNLFLAILLQNFDENTLREKLEKELAKVCCDEADG